MLNGTAWRLVTDPVLGNRDGELAVGLAKRAVERAPDQGYIVNTLGTAYYRAGEWQSAIETLKRADELHQGQFFSSDAFFIAMAHWQLGEKDAALKWHNTAVRWMDKFAADNEEQRRFRAECAALLGVPEIAPAAAEQSPVDERALYSLILDAWPEAAWAYLARAHAHKTAGESEQAQADYRQAVDLFDRASAQAPDSAQPWIQRGHAHAAFDQWGEAASAFDKAVDRAAGPAVWYHAALARLGANDLPGYRAACERITARLDELDDSGANGLALWACALAPDAASDLSSVIKLAEQAVQGDSPSLQSLNTLGALLCRAGRCEDAIKRLEQADRIAQNPGANSPPAYVWFFLAMTHHRLGHTADASTWLTKARSASDEVLKNDAAGTARVPWNRRLTLTLLGAEAAMLLGTE
jgi:tetratricopeptide (TPR) repeat protein